MNYEQSAHVQVVALLAVGGSVLTMGDCVGTREGLVVGLVDDGDIDGTFDGCVVGYRNGWKEDTIHNNA